MPTTSGDRGRDLLGPGAPSPTGFWESVETAVDEHAGDQGPGHEAADGHGRAGVPDARSRALPRREMAAPHRQIVSLRPMDDVLGYEGKNVVVTGAASGMGEQVARILPRAGCERDRARCQGGVDTGEDVAPPSICWTRRRSTGVVGEIDGPVDSVFSSAGLPGPPFTDLQTAIVNFIGARHPHRGPSTQDAGGLRRSRASHRAPASAGNRSSEGPAPCTPPTSFADAVKWCEENADVAFPMGGYRMSKVVVNQYVSRWRARSTPRQGVRINCVNPGPTATPDDAGVRGRRGQGHDRENTLRTRSTATRSPRSRRGRWSASTAHGSAT